MLSHILLAAPPFQIVIPSGVPRSEGDFIQLVQTVITLAYSLAGVIAFGILIYGGYMMMTSAGDPQNMKKGQDALVGAVVGLIVVLVSGIILNFIGAKLGVGTLITTLHFPNL